MIATGLSEINFYKKIFKNLTPCQDTLLSMKVSQPGTWNMCIWPH